MGIHRHHTAAASFIAAVLLLAFGPADRLYAQLGSGWISTTHSKRIHLDDTEGLQTFTWTPSKSVCTPTSCADYSYDAASDTETFRIFDSRSNRSEIRLVNEYSTGIRQFEGYVTFFEPLHDESLFQIFGSTSGATLCMMRGYSSSGGKLRVVGGIGDIATNSYGVERRINVIHDQNNYVQFYVDGIFKGQFSEHEQVDNYWKYGVYGTTNGNVPAVAKWRAVRTFRDGLPPGVSNTPPGAYEAEDALLSGAAVASNQSGYTGAGFADYVNSTRDYVEWTLNTPRTGLYDLKFRYALQSGNRPLSILVNGQPVVAALSFPATGAWNSWAYATIPSRLLPAGTTTVRATASGSSGPNVDHLLIATAATVLLGDYNHDGVVDAGDYIMWRKNLGRPTSLPNDDSVGVAQADYDRWRANFGKVLTTGSAAALTAAVPEPVTLWLILLAAPAVVGRQRNKADRHVLTGLLLCR